MRNRTLHHRLRGAAALILLAVGSYATAAGNNYLANHSPDLTVLIAPPPAPDSAAGRQDMQQVIALQNTRTADQLKLADGDTQKSVFRFADVLGGDFRADRLPLTLAFFKQIAQDDKGPLKQAKDYWKRPRPYNSDSEVHPGIKTEGTTPGYPSGHATFAYLNAVVLATMVPEKRAEIFARAETFAQGRVIGGVHYPSDVEAGKLSGTLIAAAMFQNPKFREDLAAATVEVRQALNLPPLQ